MSGVRQVVLLDDQGRAIGSAPRDVIHTAATPLHLAFSCYLFNDDGRVLLSRRALSKRTWPGVWTNSFCGHPQPGEDFGNAIRRHARDELGVEIHHPDLVLPDFRYRAVDPSGVVENEVCPVYVARAASSVYANPDEVAEWAWVDVRDLVDAVRAVPQLFSPWSVSQVHRLADQLLGLAA